MKILLIAMALLPLSTNAQNKGYGYIGGTSFLSEKFDKRGGITLGLGFSPEEHLGMGAGIDLLIFAKNTKFVDVHADFRVFPDGINNSVTPYLSIRPGWILYNEGSGAYTTKGSFAFSGVGGIRAAPKNGMGLFFGVGYSSISFKTNNILTRYGGLKIELGISF